MSTHQIIDTHCHYNLEPLYPDWQQHWEKAKLEGVIASIIVGTNDNTSQRAIEIAANEPALLAAVGIHPCEFSDRTEILALADLQQRFDQWNTLGPIAAIGETGLDYFRLSGSDTEQSLIKQKQLHAFQAHLEIARQKELPVLIHVRDSLDLAYRDVLEAIRPFANSIPLVLHCFSGPDWYLESALQLGCYISFAGNITYLSSQNLREHLKKVPLDRLLVETDAPYLPPQSHRGQRCEPQFIQATVNFLQIELGIDPQQLVNNARSIFTTIPATL